MTPMLAAGWNQFKKPV